MAQSIEHYSELHRNQLSNLPGQSVSWVNRCRENAMARFRTVGFPTVRDEDWRYTALRPITSKTFSTVELGPDCDNENDASSVRLDVSGFLIPDLDALRLVFVDGVYQPTLSSLQQQEEGLTVSSFAQVLNDRPESVVDYLDKIRPESGHGFGALNTAFLSDGVVVELAENCQVERPIELLFVNRSNTALAQPRNLVIARAGSKATIIERYVSESDHAALTNTVAEVVLDANAQLDYYLIQTQSLSSYQISSLWVKQAEDSRFSCRTITLGGALVRNEIRVEMAGEGAHCDMLGLYSLSGRQHVDNHTTMVHAAANCTSNELYKGVLDQRSRGVFHGRIKVEQDAQKTDAKQTNNTLILSRDAEIDTKPQLEIYADDVKCAHGATIGQMDENSLFYLRSRGIDEAAARSLLTFAFVNDVLSEVDVEPLKVVLEGLLSARLMADQ